MTARILVSAALVVVLGACSSSGGHSSAPTTTTTSAATGTARIESFVVPKSVRCGSGTSIAVSIAYAVSGSRSREIVVDGLAEPALHRAGGRVTERVHCDGVEHSVVLLARDSHGVATSEVRQLSTVLPG